MLIDICRRICGYMEVILYSRYNNGWLLGWRLDEEERISVYGMFIRVGYGVSLEKLIDISVVGWYGGCFYGGIGWLCVFWYDVLRRGSSYGYCC